MGHSVCVLVMMALGAGQTGEKSAQPIEVAAMLIRPVERVDVPAREAGVLAAVHAREGQMVSEGDLLAQIEDTEARLAEQGAKIEVEIAQANAKNDVDLRFAKKAVDVAKAELRRSLESNEKYPGSISNSEMDRLHLVVEKSQLEVEQAEHERRVIGFTQQAKENEQQTAEAKVQRHKICAPISGIVVQVNRHRGEWVMPGEAVARILRIDRLRAEGFLKAQQASADLQGRPVRLTVDVPDAAGSEFPGKIVFVDPEIDPVNAQIRIWAEIQNEGLRLRPGMRAKMTVDPGTPK